MGESNDANTRLIGKLVNVARLTDYHVTRHVRDCPANMTRVGGSEANAPFEEL